MLQNFEKMNKKIDDSFQSFISENPGKMKDPLKISWSNWGFGVETLKQSMERLAAHGLEYIELHGNHYGPDLGYRVKDVKKLLSELDMKVSGVCGMFSADSDLSSVSALHRQAAIDYIKEEVELRAEVGGTYLLVVPGAVGRNEPYDDMEYHRSIETLQIVGEIFETHNVKGAIEPIRSAEVSFIHTVADAKAYIDDLGCPGVSWINGDVYHMQSEESHIAAAVLDAGEQLVNLHMADSQRGALGTGFLDLDRIIKALYLIGYNNRDCFMSPEPLGPGGAPYPAMYGKPDRETLDELVRATVSTIKEREAFLKGESGN